jgi:hypothetical protein
MIISEIVREDLLNPEKRQQFIAWLQTVPISFPARLRLYFRWLDYFQLPYIDAEIKSLRDPVEHESN